MLNPFKIISKFIRSDNQKNLDKIKFIVEKVNELENNVSKLKDEEFPKKTELLKEKVKKGENIKILLPEAFALVREASKRTRNERHFDVQIMGGIILHNGSIAEMKTGEGKTLTIVLAAYLNALHGAIQWANKLIRISEDNLAKKVEPLAKSKGKKKNEKL